MPREINWDEPMPPCDTHRYNSNPTNEEGADGIYDGPTTLGPHGNMCDECFKKFGYPDSTITIKRVRS